MISFEELLCNFDTINVPWPLNGMNRLFADPTGAWISGGLGEAPRHSLGRTLINTLVGIEAWASALPSFR